MSVHKVDYFVIPAEAGIQNRLKSLDSRFYGNDGKAIYKQTLANGRLLITKLGRKDQVKSMNHLWNKFRALKKCFSVALNLVQGLASH